MLLRGDAFAVAMSDFDTLCRLFEEMDNDSYNEIINRKSARILSALMKLTDREQAVNTFADFIMCAVAADGKLTEDEFLFLKPTLDLVLDMDTTFEVAQKAFYDNELDQSKDYKAAVDRMVDTIGELDQDLKDDIVLLCLMVCAVDGEVTDDEKEWIAQLIQ